GRFALFDCAQEKIDFKEIQADLKEDVSPSWEKLSQTKLQPSDLQREDYFSNSVAISGELAIVGAHCTDTPGKPKAGAAYIFKLAGGTWQQQQKLQPSDLQGYDCFGCSVAISGEVAIVGAYYKDAPGKYHAGAAYIFKLEGGTWKQQQKLQPPDLQQGDYFGHSVAISGELAIVGAYLADAPGKPDAGVAYIFKLAGGTWQQQQKLQPPDLHQGDQFGFSVAISGELAIVGARYADAPGKPDAGAAYIFKLVGGTWQQQQKLQPPDLQRNDYFGYSVAISGEVAIVGAHLADAPGKPDAGVAYIFKLAGGTWQQQKLQPPDLQRNDYFGWSVAISGEVAIVGTRLADAPGKPDAGAAYIFKLAGGTWQQQQKLQPSDLRRNDLFGDSVAISGEVAIVGALYTDAPGKPNAGAVYIFQSED
ncbi:MAG: PKD domain-containing protein, partial [Symploca sp. SIO2G7]|nr:PKD domain-containing protein [Symploca sp. SIO2G7]